VESKLAETISDRETKQRIEEFRKNAIPADAIARAILYATEQPDNVDVSEMVVQPTGSR